MNKKLRSALIEELYTAYNEDRFQEYDIADKDLEEESSRLFDQLDTELDKLKAPADVSNLLCDVKLSIELAAFTAGFIMGQAISKN